LTPPVPEDLYVSMFGSVDVNLYEMPDNTNLGPECQNGTASSPNGIGANELSQLFIPQGGTRSLDSFKTMGEGKNECGALIHHVLIPTAVINNQPADVAFHGTKSYVATLGDGVYPVTAAGVIGPSPLAGTPCFSGNDFNVAADAAGNLYMSSGAVVWKWTFPAGPCAALTGTGPSYIYGLNVDATNRLIAVGTNSSGVGTIYRWPAGNPNGVAVAYAEPANATGIYGRVDDNNNTFVVGDYTLGSADVYKYPTLKYVYSITTGLIQTDTVEGVAPAPGSGR
jgi:hypothetical protein